MKALLGDVTKIQMGLSFRGKPQLQEDGGVGLIQMRDLTSDYRVDLKSPDRVVVERIQEKHLVKKGDIAFRSRGQNLAPALVEEQLYEPFILAAPLLRIRISDQSLVTPNFLTWYLTQTASQSYLASNRVGTHGGVINKTTLDNLPIEIPALQVQKQITKLAMLAKEERRMSVEITEKRYSLISKHLQKILEDSK